MIEVYDTNEKQYLMINANKIKIVYNGKYTNKTMIQIDGLNYPIEIRETYEEIKHKLKEVVNVR
nr:MAG TPA: hypothetical protein [Caudoviricetes sp.]